MLSKLQDISKVKRDPHEQRFADKVVLVTGASRGIGRAVAKEFASHGARVAILALDQTQLNEIDAELRALGSESLVIVANVADRCEVEAAMQKVWERWGRLDVLINNAGYLVYGSVEECEPEDFDSQVRVNYLGAVYCTKAALDLMRNQGAGAIVNVGSISGMIFAPFNSSYQASKAALRAFTLTLRRELFGSGISVSLVSPGRTRTDIERHAVRRGQVRGRFLLPEMPPERVARLISDCVDRPRREVIVPFVLRLLVAAYTITPDLVEQWLSSIQVKWDLWAKRFRSNRSQR